MLYYLRQSQTARPLLFLLTDSTDHTSPKTGATPTVTLSKNGGSFASPAGAISEVGSGWYAVAGNATDSGTLGPLLLHATATGADATDTFYEVIAFDPTDSAGLGLARLDTNINSRSSHSAADVWAVGSRTLTSFGTLVADVAAAVWGAASRTLSTFGFGVTVATNQDKTGYSLATAPPTAAAITNAVLDELLAGHTTTGSVAAGISAAGAAGDPLSSVVPGTYSAGTAGYRLGHLTDVQLQYVSPVLAGGKLELVTGVAYQSERGNAITFPALTSSAPDLTGATVTLEIAYGPTVLKTWACTVSGPRSAQVITVNDVTVAMNTLEASDTNRYSVWARWADGDADAIPLLAGKCSIQARP